MSLIDEILEIVKTANKQNQLPDMNSSIRVSKTTIDVYNNCTVTNITNIYGGIHLGGIRIARGASIKNLPSDIEASSCNVNKDYKRYINYDRERELAREKALDRFYRANTYQ